MKKMFKCICLVSLSLFIFLPAHAERSGKDNGKKGKGREALKKMKQLANLTIEKQNNGNDKLKGFVTRAVNRGEGNSYKAWIFLHWGDLDKKIEKCSKDVYSNWDGYVEISEGKAHVLKKIAFDDGSRIRAAGKKLNQCEDKLKSKTTEWQKKYDDIKAKIMKIKDKEVRQRHLDRLEAKQKKIQSRIDGAKGKIRDGKKMIKEPGEGSGRDKLTQANGSRIAWKAGVVGATDGLLIEVQLQGGSTSGTIKAGKFSIPFEITPVK